VILLHQIPKGVAQRARPLSESDPAGHIYYGDVTDLTISQLYAHGKISPRLLLCDHVFTKSHFRSRRLEMATCSHP